MLHLVVVLDLEGRQPRHGGDALWQRAHQLRIIHPSNSFDTELDSDLSHTIFRSVTHHIQACCGGIGNGKRRGMPGNAVVWCTGALQQMWWYCAPCRSSSRSPAGSRSRWDRTPCRESGLRGRSRAHSIRETGTYKGRGCTLVLHHSTLMQCGRVHPYSRHHFAGWHLACFWRLHAHNS